MSYHLHKAHDMIIVIQKILLVLMPIFTVIYTVSFLIQLYTYKVIIDYNTESYSQDSSLIKVTSYNMTDDEIIYVLDNNTSGSGKISDLVVPLKTDGNIYYSETNGVILFPLKDLKWNTLWGSKYLLLLALTTLLVFWIRFSNKLDYLRDTKHFRWILFSYIILTFPLSFVLVAL